MTRTSETTRDGEQVVKDVFGAGLYQQGRAFYVALEFFAMIRGAATAGLPVLPESGKTSFARNTHDFARRLVVGEDDVMSSSISTPAGLRTLKTLLRALTVPVPGRRTSSPTNWQAEHFFPFVGDLVHYDAVQRRGRVSVERDKYRGGGGLVHKIIRTDPNRERLGETRSALSHLIRDSDTALGRIVRTLATHDDEPVQAPWTDELEHECSAPESRWIELLRSGVHAISTREQAPELTRIQALMRFLPFAVAMHQMERAYACDGERAPPVIAVDFHAGPNPVRRLAREAIRNATGVVYRVLERRAIETGREHLLRASKRWREGPRTFFTTTLAGVGALNDARGERFFTFSPELIEALVLATVPHEIEFERFCKETLYDRMGFVIDGAAAGASQLTRHVDKAGFDRNAAAFADRLRELGMLQDYSDATRMVRSTLW